MTVGLPAGSGFGTSGGSFTLGTNTGISGGTGSGTMSMFGTGLNQPASTGIGGNLFASAQNQGSLFAGNPVSTSSGLTGTLGSAGTLFTTALPSTTTTPSLFSGFGTSATAATSKSTFGLGLQTATTSSNAPTVGFFGLGAQQPITATTSAAPGFGFGSTLGTTLGSTTGATSFGTLGTSLNPSGLGSSSNFGVGSLTSAAAPTSTVGLGGTDLSQSSSGLTGTGSGQGKADSKAVKEHQVPNEIISTVEAYKKYVKDQKNIREELSRISSKPLLKVQEETAALKNLLSVASNGIQRNVALVEKLKLETAQELKNAEIAQRTKDTPPGLQYENTSPTEYYQNMVVIFETRMQQYRQKIEQMEKHLLSLSQSGVLTPQELTLAIKRIHETFVALAAQLQSVHEAVKNQKEHYINYRKVFHGESTNIFEDRLVQQVTRSMPTKSTVNIGPTPFSGMSNAAAVAMASALNRTQQPSAGAPPTLGLNSGAGMFGSGSYGSGLGSGAFGPSVFGNTSLFGSSSGAVIKPLGTFGSSCGFSSSGFEPSNLSGTAGYGGISFHSAPTTPLVQSKPFQLQKPPAGNKRGKRVAHN